MCNKKIYKTYFTFPALFFYILLFIIPVILNFGYSFTNWYAIKMTGETAKFIGFDNYIDIFQDSELFMVIVRTLIFAAVTTVFKNVIGFLLALALNEGLKTKNILREYKQLHMSVFIQFKIKKYCGLTIFLQIC